MGQNKTKQDVIDSSIKFRIESDMKEEFYNHCRARCIMPSAKIRQLILAFNRECRKENIEE